jgi:hypothetical protein
MQHLRASAVEVGQALGDCVAAYAPLNLVKNALIACIYAVCSLYCWRNSNQTGRCLLQFRRGLELRSRSALAALLFFSG